MTDDAVIKKDSFRTVCHMDVYFDGTEKERQAIDIWASYFRELEKTMHRQNIIYYSVLVSIDEDRYLAILSTEGDMYIAVASTNNEIYTSCNFEDIKELPFQQLQKIKRDLTDKENYVGTAHKGEMAKAWGKAIPYIRKREFEREASTKSQKSESVFERDIKRAIDIVNQNKKLDKKTNIAIDAR